MATKTKKAAGRGKGTTKRRKAAQGPATTREAAAPTPRGAKVAAREAPVAGAEPSLGVTGASGEPATEADLVRLREATKSVYERLRAIDEDAVPADLRDDYWRDRHAAREAWEDAENAAFANLVDQQKRELPAVRASNVRLAKDVETTSTVIGVINVVSAGLGILASVVALLA